MRGRFTIPTALLLPILLVSKAHSQRSPPPALNPTTYSSPSGEYRLLVDPSDLAGRGPGNYKLTRNGKEVWASEKPYTLFKAAVANDGTAGGYAYTEGIEGFPRSRGDDGHGEFLVVILDPAGKERVRHATKREGSRFLHVDPDPRAYRLILDQEHDRLSVRLRDPDVNRRNDPWWSFELSTGKWLGEKPPAVDSPEVKPVSQEEKSDGLATVPERELSFLGKIDLEAPPKLKGPVRDVIQLDFDGSGRLGLIRAEDDRRVTFVLLDSSGKLLREVPAEPAAAPEPRRFPHCAWLEGDRWLIYLSPTGIKPKSRAFLLDTEKKTIDELREFDCPFIWDVRGFGDGGFVALAASDRELIAFDRAGRVEWRIGQDHRNKKNPAALFSPEAISVTPRKEVALLSHFENRVQFFDRRGTYLRTIDLAEAWGRKPNYPAAIASAPDGGLFVEDFHGSPPLVWMTADGTIRAQASQPRTVDGRIVGLRHFQVSPDGRLWGCDGSSAMRVTEAGIVDLVLGSPPDTGRLETVAGGAIDRRNQLYLADQRTSAVHVYSAEGKKLRVCVPDPADIAGHLSSPDIAPAEDGSVFLGGRDLGKGHLQFSPEGLPVGRKEFDLDNIKEEWHAQPGTGHFWVVGYKFLFLVDATGKKLRTIERRPDGNWLEYPGPARVLPDGSIAVAVTHGQGRNTISIFSARGDPVRLIHIPLSYPLASCFAFAGKDFVVRKGKDLFLFDGDGKPICRLEGKSLGLAKEPEWFFLARGGRELWILDAEKKAVRRFEMP